MWHSCHALRLIPPVFPSNIVQENKQMLLQIVRIVIVSLAINHLAHKIRRQLEFL